ncbi:hypothetical protein [Psychrosphaera algicola]|uniref:Beta-galactosidase n=2 Tax=Psychrosphaera TaxID=907197 RepID=A0ABT5FDV1_9GAMM|nr:hypothetical protein [Psychrosphaera sp. G1-22]MDC2888815.1 hypothetical protein [Psychrosphaera sp. G1-22]
MNLFTKYRFVLFVLAIISSHINAARLHIDLNQNWKFSLSGSDAATSPTFDDSDWKTVNVPHDWAFNKGISIDGQQGDKGGYFDGGLGWYRQSFDVSKS